MIQNRDIVYLSSIEWGHKWQAHQEIALRLAAAGNRVLYVENTGVRTPTLRDAGRVAKRLGRWSRALRSGGVGEVSPGVYVAPPLVMPPFGAAWRRWSNRMLFLPSLLRTIRGLGMRDLLLWTYLPNDTTLLLMNALRRESVGSVYYCVADFSELTPHAEKLRRSEQAVAAGSDIVFANCTALAEKLRPFNPNVYVYPVGVNLEAFPFGSRATEGTDAAATPGEEAAASLKALPGPLIGYVGGLHRHVDFDLLTEVALKRPNWSWVFVGPMQAPARGLAELPNVHLLGERPHGDLASYVRHFDVCIVPYLNNACTATVVPTKINEYLALGKPIVSTALPTVREFNDQHRILLVAEAGPEPFLRAVQQALELPQDEETLLSRRRVAETGDWNARLTSMCQLIEERIRTTTTATAGQPSATSRADARVLWRR